MRSIFDGIETVHGTNESEIVKTIRGAEMNTRSERKHGQAMVNREETLTILAGLANAKGKRELRAWQDVAVNLYADVVEGRMQLTNDKAVRDFETMQDALIGDGIIEVRDRHSVTRNDVAKYARRILVAK